MTNTLELTPPLQTSQIPEPATEVDVNKLDTAMPLAVVFKPFQTTLDKWQAKVTSLVVTDIRQVTEMAQARLARLELKDARVAMDKTRKGLVENLKARTGKIDATARSIREKIEVLEATLLESEQFAERHAAKLKAQMKFDRETELMHWVDTPILGDLSDLSEKDYAVTLENAKLLHQAKLDAIAKLAADLKAKEEAERKERARIAEENARLKAEAIEKERLAEVERQRIKAERAEEVRKAYAEKQRLEAERDEQLRKAKEESDRHAEVTRVAYMKAMADAKAEADRAAETALKERKRLEAKAQAEAKAAATLKAELDERKRIAAEENARVEALTLAAEKARFETERRAAAAPDKAKIEAFLEALNHLPLPDLANHSIVKNIRNVIVDVTHIIKEMIPKL